MKDHYIGAYCWGLVVGRTQTNHPWESWRETSVVEPDPWHHDLLRADDKPYDPDEVALIRSSTWELRAGR